MGSSGTRTAPFRCDRRANRHGQYPDRPEESPGPPISPARTTSVRDAPNAATACSQATFASPYRSIESITSAVSGGSSGASSSCRPCAGSRGRHGRQHRDGPPDAPRLARDVHHHVPRVGRDLVVRVLAVPVRTHEARARGDPARLAAREARRRVAARRGVPGHRPPEPRPTARHEEPHADHSTPGRQTPPAVAGRGVGRFAARTRDNGGVTYALAIFDLDDTLAPSKSRVHPSIVDMLVSLTRVADVAVISGGRFEQFDTQLLSSIDDQEALARIHVLPTCGTRYLVHGTSGWEEVYNEPLTREEQSRAAEVLEEGARALGLWEEDTWGERIELRGSQVTFSALGQEAPVDAKKAWDPTGEKKEALRAYAAQLLPDLEVRSGGSTSVDITRAGIDKAYGVNKLLARLALAPEQAVFFGDRLDEGGNDYPVIATGVPCVAVEGWEDAPAKVRAAVPEAFGG